MGHTIENKCMQIKCQISSFMHNLQAFVNVDHMHYISLKAFAVWSCGTLLSTASATTPCKKVWTLRPVIYSFTKFNWVQKWLDVAHWLSSNLCPNIAALPSDQNPFVNIRINFYKGTVRVYILFFIKISRYLKSLFYVTICYITNLTYI